MKYEKQLILLIGNIGSGKSTVAKEYAKKGYIVIARDSLRYMIGAGGYVFDRELEPTIFESEKMILEKFMKLGVNIVVDEVGIDVETRDKYIELAQKHSYISTALIMPHLDMKEAVDRRMRNPHNQPDRKLWEQVWSKFERRYEEPCHVEGFNHIIYLKETKC